MVTIFRLQGIVIDHHCKTIEEDEERKDNPLCTDDDCDNILTTGNHD